MRDIDRILHAVYLNSEIADGAATLDMRHVVITTDPYTGDSMFIGPFADPVAACVFAEGHSAGLVDEDDPQPIRCRVVPLMPPS